MAANLGPQITAFEGLEQLVSNWPAGISYNPNEDKYTFSISPSWLVTPESNLHVVDLDGVGIGDEITLQFPISFTLPYKSRIYFIYVSQCKNLDVLTFIPTALSGDTVNGNPVSDSFTLTGTKQLFIAICVSGNYIVHEFGSLAVVPPPPPVPTTNPTNMYRALTAPANFTVTPSFQFPNPISSDSSGTDTGHFTSYQYVPVVDPNVYVTGMDGYITAVNTVPINGLAGFIVNHAGLYRVTYNVSFSVQSGGMANPAQQNDVVVNVSATGTVIDYAPYGVGHRFKSPTNLGSYGCCSHIFDLDAGTYIVGTVGINQSYCAGLTYLVNSPPGVQHYTDLSTMTFELLEDREPPLSLMAMEVSPAEARVAKQAATADISPLHAQLSMGAVKEIQKKQIEQDKQQLQQQMQQSYSSSSSSSSSNFAPTLADFEGMINRAINARENAAAAAAASAASSSSDSFKRRASITSAPSPAPPQKRKRMTSSTAKEKEEAVAGEEEIL